MKKIRVEDAVGMKLCHDITKIVPGEFKGRLFARGHIIQPEDIGQLLNIGKQYISVWEENSDEVHEDDAAVRISKAVSGQNIQFGGPKEGKILLESTTKGLFKINSSLLRKMNSIDDVTIASKPNNYIIEKGDRLAGVRIVPLFTKEKTIKKLEKLCSLEGTVFQVNPYRKLKVVLVITGTEIYNGRINDKFGPLLSSKLEYYNAQLVGQTNCPDDMGEINKAISDYLNAGADLIMVTGGMSVDPDDLTPKAIKNTGARVVAYGVPVQPGNMFMLAYLDNAAIMGIPGGAIYNKISILDAVLPKVFTGEIMTKDDFIAMGEGGFCNCCTVCQYPNCYFCKAK